MVFCPRTTMVFAVLLLLACAASGPTDPDGHESQPQDLFPDLPAPDAAHASDSEVSPVDDPGSDPGPVVMHGQACTSSDQCQGGMCVDMAIHPAFVGGYCTSLCDPDIPEDCGPGAACFPVEAYPPLCVRLCGSDADCRPPHYVCKGSCLPAFFVSEPPRPGRVTSTDPGIAAVLAGLDPKRRKDWVDVLAGVKDGPDGPIRSRAVKHADHAKAVDFLEAELQALGLDVQRRPFQWNGLVLTNLVADIPGMNPALPPVLLTAHLDSTASHTPGWSSSTDPAPGANDNGSGVAIVLDVATALTEPGVPMPPRTVRVVLFDGEEVGLRGSAAYLKDESGPMACALNIDMVGAASDATPRHFWVQYSTGSAPWAGLSIEASAAFAPTAFLIPTDFADTGGSDSDSFWNAGQCSVALIAWPRLSVNHTIGDLPDKFDGDFYDAVARSAAAMLAAWAYFGT